jgi:hypothetical protein
MSGVFNAATAGSSPTRAASIAESLGTNRIMQQADSEVVNEQELADAGFPRCRATTSFGNSRRPHGSLS